MPGSAKSPTPVDTVTVTATAGGKSAKATVTVETGSLVVTPPTPVTLPVSSPAGTASPSSQPTPGSSTVYVAPAVIAATGTVAATFTAADLPQDGTVLAHYWNGAHWIAVPTAYTAAGAEANVPGGVPVVLMKSVAVQFTDTAGNWANADILKLQSLGLISGDGTGNYHPNDAVDRYALAKMIALAAGLNVTTPFMTRLNELADADKIPAWASPYVAAVLNAGLMTGTDTGFAGDTVLTRAQAATVLGRILPPGSPSATLTFTDTDQIPTWAREGVAKAVGAGLITGQPDNTFDPNSPMTRAQLAAVISRLLDLLGVR